MAKKPGKIYRQANKPAFTRTSYMGGIPASKIISFDMGNINEDFEIEVSLVVKEDVQITHNALEAARVSANRYLSKEVGTTGFHLKIRVHPHQVLRENKMASGAGADRVSQGMSLSFGKAVGRAARVRRGQRILTVRTSAGSFQEAKSALLRAAKKIPCGSSIIIDKGMKLLDI